jgi:hypothetical protein
MKIPLDFSLVIGLINLDHNNIVYTMVTNDNLKQIDYARDCEIINQKIEKEILNVLVGFYN